MRTLLLVAALALTPWVWAQPGPDAPRPVAIDNPEAALTAIGRAWADLETEMPVPDSGAVAEGTGSVRWSTTEDEVEWIQADVRDGYVVRLAVRPGADVEAADLEGFARELRTDLGRPGPNGYHDATNWAGFRRELDRPFPAHIKIQMAMFVADRLLVIRLTPGSSP